MVAILDTTLREGEQTPGVYFSPRMKLEIAIALDEAGIDIIEVGNPNAHPTLKAAIHAIAAARLKAKISTYTCCEISHVQTVLDCGVTHCGVHVSASHQRDRARALAHVQAVLGYVKTEQPSMVMRLIIEDAVRAPFENLVAVAAAAAEAGADIICIADASGYLTPFPGDRHIGSYVAQIKTALAERKVSPQIELHLHNDRGLAIANALAGVEAGADIVDASVLGFGERAGIVDVLPLASTLAELDPDCAQRYRLGRLRELYELASRHSRRLIPHTAPISGAYAFTHYSGVHVKAVRSEPSIYMSLDPRRFGVDWSVALGVQSGRHSIELALETIGREDLVVESDKAPLVEMILDEVKSTATRGEPVEVMKEFLSIVWRCERTWRASQR